MFEHWRDKVILGWGKESGRDPSSGSPQVADIPEHTWRYWYQRVLVAMELPDSRPDSRSGYVQWDID